MICDKCGTSNPEDSRFCNFCASPLQQNENIKGPVGQGSQNNRGPVIGMRPLFNSGTTQRSSLPPNNQQGSLTQNQPNAPIIDRQNNHSSSFKPIGTTFPPTGVGKPPMATQGIYCSQCQANNPPGAAFCGVCGNPLENTTQSSMGFQGIICPACRTTNHINASFCKNCGRGLIKPSQQGFSHRVSIPSQHITPKTGSRNLWVGIAGFGAILTLICFFFPFSVIKIANPLAWLTQGPEIITLNSSSMTYLTLSAPKVKGAGGVGEAARNLYNEMDMGHLLLGEAAIVVQIAFGLLLLCSLATILLTIQAYRTSGTRISKLMIFLGGIAIIFLIILSLGIKMRFNTGDPDMDLLVNSIVKSSSGLGFWGMLIGFASFSLGGYLRNQ